MTPTLTEEFGRLLPDYIISVGATILLIVGALSNDVRMRDFLRWLALIILGTAAFSLAVQPTDGAVYAGGWLIATPMGNTFGLVFLSMVAWLILANRLPGDSAGEWYGLYLFAASGMLILSRAANLPAVFMGVELMSLSLYILVAFRYHIGSAVRGAMQYLVLASFASAFLAFGLALIYAGTGTMSIPQIQQMLTGSTPMPASQAIAYMGAGLFLVGVGFKLSAVPFHMWAGDVYEAAPAPVAGLIASASKGATFAALIPFAVLLAPHATLVSVLIVASVLVGNLLALRENRLHRILAYSSIAHVGYLLMGFLAGSGTAAGTLNGTGSVLFYVAAYGIATLGAFSVLGCLQNSAGTALTLRDLRGVAKRSPGLAFALMVFVVSMSGLPPTIGFHGKLYLFTAAYAAGYPWLVLAGLIGSAIGLFYYLRIVMHLYMMPSDAAEIEVDSEPLGTKVLVATAIVTIVLSLAPALLAGVLGI